jgi:sarcosine oxidase gamma subunit
MVASISQYLVSGDLGNWSRLAGMSGDRVGAFGLVTGSIYAVRIARDRMLAINPPADAAVAGWHANGFAVTDMSAALCVIEMQGENLAQIIRRATPVDPRENSPSANCQFARVSAAIYHHGDRNKVRLHVDRSLASHVWTWLELNISTAVGAEL